MFGLVLLFSMFSVRLKRQKGNTFCTSVAAFSNPVVNFFVGTGRWHLITHVVGEAEVGFYVLSIAN